MRDICFFFVSILLNMHASPVHLGIGSHGVSRVYAATVPFLMDGSVASVSLGAADGAGAREEGILAGKAPTEEDPSLDLARQDGLLPSPCSISGAQRYRRNGVVHQERHRHSVHAGHTVAADSRVHRNCVRVQQCADRHDEQEQCADRQDEQKSRASRQTRVGIGHNTPTTQQSYCGGNVNNMSGQAGAGSGSSAGAKTEADCGRSNHK